MRSLLSAFRTTARVAALVILNAAVLCAQGRVLARDTMTSFAVGGWGVALGDQDRSLRPGDDFWKYQNGAWYAQEQRESPAAMNAYWRDLKRLAPRRLTVLLREAASDASARSQSPRGLA